MSDLLWHKQGVQVNERIMRFLAADDVMRQDQRCRARVVTPEQKGIAVRDIGRWNFNAEGISEARILMPIANVSCRNPVRAPEAV